MFARQTYANEVAPAQSAAAELKLLNRASMWSNGTGK